MNETPSKINLILKQAVESVIQKKSDQPAAETVITALLEQEKQTKKGKSPIYFSQLLGKWQLCFVSGTKKAPKRKGFILGKGRYLTQWVKIYLNYRDIPLDKSIIPSENREYGQISNQVQLAGLTLTLTGPAQLLTDKRILAFDFTQIKINIGNLTLYQGEIRGGKKAEALFYQDTIKKQAFFAYFAVEDDWIAARGKGGGLALWGKC